MTSLADVYEGHVGEVQSVRRLYLGTGLFLAGAALTVLGMVVATTGLPGLVGIDGRYGQFRIAGVLAGLGAPAVFVGVSTVLPAALRIRAAAGIGASVAVLGVALFWYAYPEHWLEYGRSLTPYVVGVYFLGIMTTLWCVFVGIANFKQRNDPGGTVSLQVTTDDGETRVVEVDRESAQQAGLGGVGMLGGTPDGEVETQTNDAGRSSAGSGTGTASTGRSGTSDGQSTGTRASGSRSAARTGTGTRAQPNARSGAGATTGTEPSGFGETSPASDGGSSTSDISSPLDVGPEAQSGTDPDVADQYCGNCRHFQYVRKGSGMQPYCGYHDSIMDDMDACDEWAPNK